MPYVTPKRRNDLLENKGNTFHICVDRIDCAGDLQFLMAELFHSYLQYKGLNYQHCNDIMGALVGAQAEFYREVVAPYEDSKIDENGPVYWRYAEYPKPGKY